MILLCFNVKGEKNDPKPGNSCPRSATVKADLS